MKGYDSIQQAPKEDECAGKLIYTSRVVKSQAIET
jgi:hypothetical protein